MRRLRRTGRRGGGRGGDRALPGGRRRSSASAARRPTSSRPPPDVSATACDGRDTAASRWSGFMGAGKTHVGPACRAAAGCAVRRHRHGPHRPSRRHRALFAARGEEGFRELERVVVAGASSPRPSAARGRGRSGGRAVTDRRRAGGARAPPARRLARRRRRRCCSRARSPGTRPLARDEAQFEALYARAARCTAKWRRPWCAPAGRERLGPVADRVLAAVAA